MRIIYGLLIFIGAMLLQWAWGTYFSIFELAPQVLLVTVAAVGAAVEPAVGLTMAFIWGIFLDVLSAHLFGANALLLTSTAYVVSMGRRQMDVSTPLSQSILVGIISLVYLMTMAFLGGIFEGHILWPGWKTFLFTPILNMLIAPFVFSWAGHWNRR